MDWGEDDCSGGSWVEGILASLGGILIEGGAVKADGVPVPKSRREIFASDGRLMPDPEPERCVIVRSGVGMTSDRGSARLI
jgi:sulfur carrier protein ThiS